MADGGGGFSAEEDVEDSDEDGGDSGTMLSEFDSKLDLVHYSSF